MRGTRSPRPHKRDPLKKRRGSSSIAAAGLRRQPLSLSILAPFCYTDGAAGGAARSSSRGRRHVAVKMNTPVRHRLVLWLSSALLLALLGLAGCGLSATRTHVFTAAEILQNATNVLDVSGTAAAHPTSSATVKDLTFTMKFTVSMNLSSSSQGKQQFTETMTATGKETLAPRRTQMDMSMAMDVPGLSGLTGGGLYPLTGGQALTMNTIVDYDSQTAYIKSPLFDSLLKGSSDSPA